MIERLRRTYRRMLNRCPGCGALAGEVVRITVDIGETFEYCRECGSPHEIWGVMRCPLCQALLDDDERLYPDDPEEMEGIKP